MNASGQRTSVIHNVTPVYFAAQEGHTHVVMELIKAGADVNQASSLGITPLYVAAQQGHEGIVALLIQAGADARKAMQERGHANENRHNKSAGEGRDVVEVLRASLELPSRRSMKRHHRAMNHHAPSLSPCPHAASASGPRFADAKTATGSLEILAFHESHHFGVSESFPQKPRLRATLFTSEAAMDTQNVQQEEAESDTVTYLRRGMISILDVIAVKLPDVFTAEILPKLDLRIRSAWRR